MAQIELRGVTKIFGPRPEAALARLRQGATKEALLAETGHTVGLNDVSLDIRPGETFVVMGLSGSGKSTLIRHLNRLIEPTAGEILVDGEAVTGLGRRALRNFRRRRMSMVFQGFGLFPHRTVFDNVAFGLEVRGDGRAAAQDWIVAVGLDGYERAYPRELSGGMRQRVGLARALAADTDVLLMDEPFSALDPLIRRDMQAQLAGLQQRLGKTIVFITHDLDEALRLGDRIAILRDGAVEQVGAAAEILRAPASRHVAAFVGDVNRIRVLTAGDIRRPALVCREDEPAAAVRDRLAAATTGAAMGTVAGAGADAPVAFLVDGGGRPQGALTAADADAAAASGQALRARARPVERAGEEEVLDDILARTLVTDLPLAVTDDAGAVTGQLTRRDIIAALAAEIGAAAETGAAETGTAETGTTENGEAENSGAGA